MTFLIVYSRATQRLKTFRAYADVDEEQAQSDRFQAELEAMPAERIEALLLRAESEQAVRTSHARYFENASSLLRDLRKGA